MVNLLTWASKKYLSVIELYNGNIKKLIKMCRTRTIIKGCIAMAVHNKETNL